MAVSGGLGLAFERVIVRPVYGQHLKQILVTTGGLIVAEQLLKVVWGPEQITLTRPTALRGAILLGDIAIEKYRLLAVVIGLLVFAALALTLNRTRIGLLDPRRRRERRDGRGAGLSHPPPVRRRVRRRLGAGRAWAARCGASTRRR